MSRPSLEQDSRTPFAPELLDSGVTVVMVPRQFSMYRVTEEELENLYSAGNYKTLDVGLFSLTLGIFVTLIVTLVSVNIHDPRTFAAFSSSAFVSLIGSVFCAIRAVIAWRRAKRGLEAIKRSSQ